jgi:hypothetical protein
LALPVPESEVIFAVWRSSEQREKGRSEIKWIDENVGTAIPIYSSRE